MKKRYSMLFVAMVCVVLLISAGTYAYWVWTSNINKSVVFNISSAFEDYVVYDSGDSYFVGDFQPSDSYCDGLKNTISFKKKNDDIELIATINMRVDAIGENIKNSDHVYWVVTAGDSSNCLGGLNNALAYGTFKDVSSGSEIKMLKDIIITTTEQKFTTWIWIDDSGTNLSSLSGETLDTKVWTQIDMVDGSNYKDPLLNGADPVIEEGMVPIVLSSTGVATVANMEEEWYNYGDKEWANAVLVKENATSGITGSKSREYYLNNPGTTVLESDILAYYVWIPRYKYQIWTTDATQTTSPQTINIVFENKNTAKSKGTSVGQYLTHPAFSFGNKELNGIWVGKFETSAATTSTCYTSESYDNCDNTNQEPRILPNVKSLRYQNVSNQFKTALKLSGGSMNESTGIVTFAGSRTYGLTNRTDSHMMKNSEWGSVAYLSHSQYGINQEIYINNSSGYYTGRSGGNVGGSQNTLSVQFGSGSTSTRHNSYGYYTWTGQPISSSGTIGTISDSTLGTNSSTTGNITGIYDMSGGAFEYVMGNYNNTASYSGYPENKYYDNYTVQLMTSCTLETCGGHALYETASWYSDYDYFANDNYSWFERGGRCNDRSSAGAFSSATGYGNSDSDESFRSVITEKSGSSSSGGSSGGGSSQQPVVYTVNYNVNGGSGTITEQTKTHDVALTLSSTVPTRTGYDFLGWSTSSSATSATYTAGSSYTKNESVTLYAVWKAKTYTVSYNANGGSGAPSSQTKTYGVDLTLSSTVPTRDGYTFLGWSASSSATSATYQAGGKYTDVGNVTLYAVWKEVVSAISNDNIGEYIDLGNDIIGSNGSTTDDWRILYVENGNVYAILADFLPNSTNYATNAGLNLVTNKPYGVNSTVNRADLLTKLTTNSNWSGLTNGITGATATGAPTEELILNSYRTEAGKEPTNNTFDSTIENYSLYVSQTGDYNGTHNYWLATEASGNTTDLKGIRYSGEVRQDSYDNQYMGLRPVVLLPSSVNVTKNGNIWIVGSGSGGGGNQTTTYTISYDANGGSGVPSSQTKTHDVALTLSSTVPTRTGYDFLGWSTSSTATSATYQAGGSYTSNASITLYAVWKAKTYTVSYDANGGSGAPSSQTKTFAVDLTLSSTVPTRTGYDFLGWSTSSTATSATYQASGSYTENASITLYAVWKAKMYNIKYDVSSLNINTLMDTTGEKIFDVVYDGEYKLEVWGAEGGGGVISGSITYSGGYGGYSYGTVSLNRNDKLYVNVGGQGTTSGDSSAAGGYNGGGATQSNNYGGGRGSGGGATHIATSSGLLSTFSSKLNQLLIVAGGGGGGGYYNTSQIGDGGNGGGYIGSSGTGSNGTPGTGGSQTSGGTGTATGSFGKGADAIKTYQNNSYGGPGGGGGYYGGGAAYNNSGGGGGSGYIGNSLLTNKAMYCYSCTTSNASSTLTYSNTNVSNIPTAYYSKTGNGAARISTLSVVSKITSGSTYGSYFDNLGLEYFIPEKEGYTFKGWYDATSGGNLITSSTVMTKTQDHTLYPQWQEAYTISYDANGGSGAPSSQKKVYGEDITLSSVEPTKEGYTFLGWSTSSTATSATYTAGSTYTANASAILYAVWKQDIVSPVSSYSCSNKKVGSSPYFMTYTGQCTMIDDGSNNWRVKFLTSGTLKFTSAISIDAFLVGGGGGGGSTNSGWSAGMSNIQIGGGGGGGGGDAVTKSAIEVKLGVVYQIDIGAGGAASSAGQATSIYNEENELSITANGGNPGGCAPGGGAGGTGGNKGGNGAHPGNRTSATKGSSGASNTKEFGESTGELYAGGGGGGGGYIGDSNAGIFLSRAAGGDGGGGYGGKTTGESGKDNTGGGGGGGGVIDGVNVTWGQAGGSGGSGIVVIRNKR